MWATASSDSRKGSCETLAEANGVRRESGNIVGTTPPKVMKGLAQDPIDDWLGSGREPQPMRKIVSTAVQERWDDNV